MSTVSHVNDPRVATCTVCGTALASDQRYCLGCGARRDQARLPFQDALVPVGPPAGPPTGPPPALWYPPAPPSGGSTPTILAALACVLVAFGVGVLVGGGKDGPTQPVVIGGTAGPAATAAPTATTAEPGADGADPSASTAKDESAASGDKAPDTADVAPADKADAAEVSKTPAKVKAPVAISESVRKNLGSKDPDKAREASESLPDVVSTGE